MNLAITILKNIYICSMTMINRILQEKIKEKLFKKKAILILGPRQVGKTTLIYSILEGRDFLFLDGDDASVRQIFENINTFQLKQLIGPNKIIFIDEAQRIPEIGLSAKIITDQFKDVQLILSGSSALEINNKTQEALTGRKWEYNLYPICWQEFESTFGYLEAEKQLEHRLIFGMYPDVISGNHEEHKILKDLTNSYLYKDVLSLTGLRKPEILERLLEALALQIGSEVSYNELSNLLGIDKGTVIKYIDILEKAFIIFELRSFNRNQPNEIKNNRKIYFYDNGVRNIIINNLNSISLRNDKAALWENFLISERIKMQAYHQIYTKNYFWRTTIKQEIDWIEEVNGVIDAFEFKWKNKTTQKIPTVFKETYGASGKFIDRSNFREFICKE